MAMKCYVHPQADSIGVCTECGRAICNECAVEVRGRLLCRGCLSGASSESLSGSRKPGMVQAIAVMCLVDGILNILWGIGLTISLMLGIVTIICVPIGIYPIVLAVFEIMYAMQLLPEPAKVRKPAQYLAIMQIANIVSGDAISLIIGIVSLVFYNDTQVKAYFERQAAMPQEVASVTTPDA